MTEGFLLEYKPNRRERFWRRFYPGSLGLLPDLPEDFEDAVIVHTKMHLNWPDRLRTLLSGAIEIRTVTALRWRTEVRTIASVSVVKPPYQRGGSG
jgi:hypothetical protein